MVRIKISDYVTRNIRSLMDRFQRRGIKVTRIGDEIEYDEKDHEAIMRILNQ